jgi:energy-coupling factor transporter ATP-binding protein EcfA2
MRNIPLEFPIFQDVYGGEFPIEQYFVILFDSMPSKSLTRNIYGQHIIDWFKQLGFVEDARNLTAKRPMEKSCHMLFINRGKKMLIATQSDLLKDPDAITFEILYDIKNGELEKQIDFSVIKSHQQERKKASIQLVRSDMGHLDIEEYDLAIPELNIELNYGKDFVKIHETIVKRLNTNGDKGIILLHGDTGTGKTTFLKYLTKQIKEKNILFIPPSMAEILSEPSIIPFLMENRNSILLIEDSERVIADRESKGSPAGVSNLLNLTDGILGDCLNIQVIATFNMKRERIDSALLRKGRLICEHKFENLSIENTNKLLKHLGKDVISEVPLSLADIYNIDVDDIRVTKNGKKIGF